MKRVIRSVAVLAVGAGLLFIPIHASAQPSASDRETARTLHLEGRDKLAARDYGGAVEKLKPAHEIMRVPTTGLDLAKAQEGLGLLVEARSTALEVANMEPNPSEPQVFAEARGEAGKLADQLAPRIPSLVIKVAPAAITPVVTVDGAEVRSALGLPRKVNPGSRTVVVTATGHVTETRTVTVTEGETVPLEITLRRAEPASVKPASGSPASLAGGVPAGQADPGAQPSGGIPTWAWVSGAAGIAAFGVGIGFATDIPRARDGLYEVCPNAKCSTLAAMDQGEMYRGQWNRDLGVSVACGVLGLAGVGTAIAGIVMAPRKKQAGLAPLTFAPWAGPVGGGGMVSGTF